MVLGVALSAACATRPPPAVTFHADEVGMEALRGSWTGQYWSDETGRHGAIRFELSAAGDTARGDVTMVPEGRDTPLAGLLSEEWCGPAGEAAPSKVLRIHFVRAHGATVQGTLDAYRDPRTGHRLVTTFRGRVEGDIIRGSYSSYDCASGERARGQWEVDRVDSPGG